MDFENIRLAKEAGEPLYRQLAEQLKTAIRQGKLSEGEKLPPIRAWKTALGVSPVTATQAYEVLAEEGYASGQVGRGTYVRRPAPQDAFVAPSVRAIREPVRAYSPSAPSSRLSGFSSYIKASRGVQVQRYFQAAQARYRAAGGADELVIMTSGSPAPEIFALKRWKTAMARAGESFERESLDEGGSNQPFQYGSALGDEATRAWLAEYLGQFGVRAALDEVLLTSGSQQALDLVARVLVGPGDPVIVESPSYFSALEILDNRQAACIAVPVDDEGLRLDSLERLLERYQPRLLYTVPTSQSPTGVTLSVERRLRLLELARRYNFIILEDDTCNEYYLEDGPALPSLQSFDNEGRVIYLKSFSKLIFPAVRFGCIVAGGGLMEKLAEAKAVFDRASSLPVARTVLKFAASPAFERELKEGRVIYRERRDALISGLSRELAGSGCSWSRCQGGFSLLLTLPPGLTAEEFHLAAAEKGVAVLPGAVFYPVLAEAPVNTLRLSFGDNSPARLEQAARRLGQAFGSLRTRQNELSFGSRFITAV